MKAIRNLIRAERGINRNDVKDPKINQNESAMVTKVMRLLCTASQLSCASLK